MSAWVTCAPGDSTEIQWDAIWRTSGEWHACATEYSLVTGAVRFTVDRRGEESRYVVNLRGEVTER